MHRETRRFYSTSDHSDSNRAFDFNQLWNQHATRNALVHRKINRQHGDTTSPPPRNGKRDSISFRMQFSARRYGSFTWKYRRTAIPLTRGRGPLTMLRDAPFYPSAPPFSNEEVSSARRANATTMLLTRAPSVGIKASRARYILLKTLKFTRPYLGEKST